MSSTSSYLAVASGHIDSLISYVLDVKPYHAKLAAAVEQYVFHDDVNVKVIEDDQLLAFLGADNLPFVGTSKVRARRTQSWYRDAMSDGYRTIWQVPLTTINKMASHSSNSVFYAGYDPTYRSTRLDDDLQIPGIQNIPTNRAFNPKRWDGPGITNVQQFKYNRDRDPRFHSTLPATSQPWSDPAHQQGGYDYFLSKGAFSFNVTQGTDPLNPLMRWKEANLEINPDFPEAVKLNAFGPKSGALQYTDSIEPSFSIKNITGGNYEEWTITYSGSSFEVVGSASGSIGTCTMGTRFTHALISFDVAPGFEDLSAGVNVEPAELIDGDFTLLVPYEKITVAPDAPEETWSLIKTNPIAIDAPGVKFVSSPTAPARTVLPALEVHTESLDYSYETANWTITFNGGGTYTLQRTTASGKTYGTSGLTVNLIDGCGYKDDYIQFTLIPSLEGYFAGDSFHFTVSARVENYLVYGSISGWLPNLSLPAGAVSKGAKIGEWYWNGKIGFKIPKLEYFAESLNSTIITSSNANAGFWDTSLSNSQIVKSVSYDSVKKVFFISGQDEVIGVSANGTDWSADLTSLIDTSSTPEYDFLITVGQAGTIAIGLTDASQELLDPSSGLGYNPPRHPIVWTKQASHVNQDLNDVVQLIGPLNGTTTIVNLSVVVGNDGIILSSINGNGWALHPSGTSNNLNSIAWSPSMIVAVGDHGTILYSNDRLTWTAAANTSSAHLNSIVYEPTINSFIAVGSSGTILRSNDGITWYDLAVFQNGTFSDVVYGDGKFVAVDSIDGWVASSPDGITWTRYKGKKLNGIAYGNGVYVGVGGTPYDVANFIPLPLTAAYKDGITATSQNNLHSNINPAIHSSAEPSSYTITFITPTTATVINNLYGYKRGVVLDETWTDGIVCFKIPSLANGMSYAPGDTIRINLAPKHSYTSIVGYDESSYWSNGYDADTGVITTPLLYNEELFPLYHSHGSVIFRNVTDGDKFVIDKAANDSIRLRIEGANILYPELAPDGNDWIPLEFKYWDRLENGVPVSPAEFSDLTTYIEAYLGSNPSVKVFHVLQPRYSTSNRNESATFVFDQTFVTNYLKFGTNYSLMFKQDESYGQKIRVKITENMKAFARINLVWNDVTSVSVYDSPITAMEIVGDIQLIDAVNVVFAEGGALPVRDVYSIYPYNTAPYNQSLGGSVLHGLVENPPGSGLYSYTGLDTDYIIPQKTNHPSISVEQVYPPRAGYEDFAYDVIPLGYETEQGSASSNDDTIASTAIVEGLAIMERIPVDPITGLPITTIIDGYEAYPYDTYPYDTNLDFVVSKLFVLYDMAFLPNGMVISQAAEEYSIIVVNRTYRTSPTIIMQEIANPANVMNPTPDFSVWPQNPLLVSLESFKFSAKNPITGLNFPVPFRLTLV